MDICELANYKFEPKDYSKDNLKVYMRYDDEENELSYIHQRANQFLTFRLNNPYNGVDYYGTGSDQQDGTKLPSYANDGAVLYPHLTQKNSLSQLDSIGSISYKLLNPGESITIPLEAKYKLSSGASTSFNRTMSFDLRTSLYRDFMNYTFTVVFTKVTKVDNDIYSNNAVNEYNVVI